MKQLLFGILALSLTACESSLQTPPVVETESQKIVNGQVVNGDDEWSRSVVGLAVQTADGPLDFFCSGTLVKEGKVLTAAHCITVAENTPLDPGEELVVVFAPNLSRPTQALRPIKSSVKHDLYLRDFDNWLDIGLISFSGDVPEGSQPATLLRNSRDLQNGELTLVAGFGYTESASKDGMGTLRSTQVRINNIEKAEHEATTDESVSATCGGDSGGPAFLYVDGRYELWGVISRGDTKCAEYGVYTRADKLIDWINAN